MSTEEDDMAAAWGEALEAEGAPESATAAATPDATRVLNQQEIDSLRSQLAIARAEAVAALASAAPHQDVPAADPAPVLLRTARRERAAKRKEGQV